MEHIVVTVHIERIVQTAHTVFTVLYHTVLHCTVSYSTIPYRTVLPKQREGFYPLQRRTGSPYEKYAYSFTKQAVTVCLLM